ncbi:hypothetical protein U9M73_13240 [Paenibacillus phoenicis]|uniref:Uncharacterized protein n=1 Tax=Paenibacillus phoenicis TaxID=554117 RepID=A0ABU5PLZ1_9BACL|nr:hypothetical protein [Paenibacillus phoenicis]MEA3570950.1 hypothetical protein [Paenibacillus phoenicis]
MKTTVDRIAYFTRKANQYGALRFDCLRGRSAKRSPAGRFNRLMAYKAAVTRQIKAERQRSDDADRANGR